MNRLQVIKHVEICQDQHYNCFPSAIKQGDGTIVVGFRQATDQRRNFGHNTHVDPTSKAVYVTSLNGETWERPQIIYDDFFYGVQDPCLNLLKDGTIFATFFMWKVFDAADVAQLEPSDHQLFGKWVGRLDRVYSIRSTDGGATWDEPIPFPYQLVALRGCCVEMDDGSILAPLYGAAEAERTEGVEGAGTSKVVIVRTEDQGKTWTNWSTIDGCDGYDFQEPHLYQTESGKLVAFIRTHKKEIEPGQEADRGPLYTSESLDNGKTWSRPQARPFYSESPFQAVRLQSGNVLLTYGYRHEPYGIRAAILDAECNEINEAEDIILREDGISTDIGYTSAVQFDDGRILITYYYYDTENSLRYIAGTICEEVVK
ncbi:sialidase family protein [Paenibacillus eucommiae]|uniref:Sialidase domain-containing protein n=1 Tax=Paenibacillus eucommiae TaxID=1355755 RepID=A0ABS4IMT5_9BACL|nr:sialidase family protein [Paenibacillus eucommiae]MBP1988881.1 hypothetical protein [Paenibacillus eucommiae]